MDLAQQTSDTMMRQQHRRRSAHRLTLLAILSILAAFVVAVFWVPRKNYAEFVASQIAATATRAGLNMVLTDTELRLGDLHVRKAEIFVPKLLSTFQLEDLTVKASLLPLLTGRLRLDTQARIWGGTISSSAHYNLWSGRAESSIEIQGITLPSIIQLQAFGIESGTISGSVRDAVFHPQELARTPWTLTATSWSVRVEGMTKTQDTFLQLPRHLGGGFLAIPAFQQLNLSATGAVSPGTVTCSGMRLQSSLGELSAVGALSAAAVAPTISLSGNATLSEESTAKFGAFLPMISQGSLSSSDRALKFEIKGTLVAPVLQLGRKG